jgi:hypothetical protein
MGGWLRRVGLWAVLGCGLCSLACDDNKHAVTGSDAGPDGAKTDARTDATTDATISPPGSGSDGGADATGHPSGHAGGGLVPGGTVMSSARFRIIGAMGSGSAVSASPRFELRVGSVAATQGK